LTKGRLPSRTQPTRTRSRNVKKYPRNLNLELLHLRIVADITGDGRADIVGFGNDGVGAILGNGDGNFSITRSASAAFGYSQGWRVDLHPRFLADITGNGRPDIVGFGDDGVWIALNNGDGTFGQAEFVLADFGAKSGRTGIKHVFVCMLENRSYDHFLGLAHIDGTDAHSGAPTTANGLSGGETQTYESESFTVTDGAEDRIENAPPHNFNDFMVALCGADRNNFSPNGAAYPAVNGSGYAAAYGIVSPRGDAGDIMACFPPNHLPVLNALAQEFAVCDNWFGSMPGPTEPNRMFVHAANCDTWDDSPSGTDQIEAEAFGEDISFDHGTIFDRLRKANVSFRIYADDDFPNAAILHGISVYNDINDYKDLADDLNNGYDAAYTFIEPNYAVVSFLPGGPEKFFDGNSQHPRGGVAAGEDFIKSVYETIRNSPVWNSSMLVIVWDEAGGFYDHVLPPRAVPTGKVGKKHGFLFDQLGSRVPAIVISPLIPKKIIERRVLEHSVIPATIEQLFQLDPLTARDANIVGLQSLATLKAPRTDTPAQLPSSVIIANDTTAADPDTSATGDPGMPASGVPRVGPDTRLSDIRDENFLPSLQSAAIQNMVAAPDQHDQILARLSTIHTIGDYQSYMQEVSAIVKQKRAMQRAARLGRRDVVIRDHRLPLS
jgi:phospholipase C